MKNANAAGQPARKKNNRAVFMTIRPSWAGLILSGQKTIEVRKNIPHAVRPPFTAYLYCSKGEGESWYVNRDGEKSRCDGAVVAAVSVDRLDTYGTPDTLPGYILEEACLSEMDFWRYYVGYRGKISGWHISGVKLLDAPMTPSDFGLDRVPQSWCYVTERQNGED